MGWRTLLTSLTGRRGKRTRSPASAASAPPPAARGLGFALLRDPDGDDACVGCGLCATVCPPAVISVRAGAVSVSPHTGVERGWVDDFVLDARRCTACELCMQVCPTDALRLFPDPTVDRPRRLDLEELRANAARVRGGPRRSPLGPAPGTRRAASATRPRPPIAAGAERSATPTPALDLGRPGAGQGGTARTGRSHPVELATGEPTRMESLAHPVDAPTEQDEDSIAAVADPGDWLPTGGPHPDDQPTGRPDLEGVDLSEQLDSDVWLESDDELIEFTAAHTRSARTRRHAVLDVAPRGVDVAEPADDDPTENPADDPTENLDPDSLPGRRT